MNAKVFHNNVQYHSDRVEPWEEEFIDTLQIGSANPHYPYQALIIIDNYSKFVEGFILTDKRGSTIRNCLNSVVARYGNIKIKRCDNGTEFDNAEVQQFLQQPNITRK